MLAGLLTRACLFGGTSAGHAQPTAMQLRGMASLPDPRKPLRLFLCAAEPHADAAGAALLEALRHQHKAGVAAVGLVSAGTAP